MSEMKIYTVSKIESTIEPDKNSFILITGAFNMKTILFLLVSMLTACSSSTTLKEGRWTGHLTPMNHPDMNQPISYDVFYENNELNINLMGPDGVPVALKNPRVHNDTLYFSFNEPEQQVPLECKLAMDTGNGFTGRCTDASGKWAQFTMNPPE